MTQVSGFYATNDTAADTNQPLDTDLLQRLASSLNTVLAQNLPASNLVLRSERPLLLHGSPYRLLAGPWLAYTRPGDAAVTLTLDVTCVDAEVTLWGAMLFADGLGPLEGETVVSVGDDVVEVVIPIPTREREKTVHWVTVVAASETTATGQIVVAANAGDEVFGRWVRMGAGFAFDYDHIYRLDYDPTGYEEDRVPAPRLCLGFSAGGGGDYAYIWPPLDLTEVYEGDFSTPSDIVTKQGITLTRVGFLKVWSVEIRVTDTRPYQIPLVPLAGGRRPSARWIRQIPAQAAEIWRSAGPIAHQGIIDPYLQDPEGVSAPYTDVNGEAQVLPMGCMWPYPDSEAVNNWRVVGAASISAALKAEDYAANATYKRAWEVCGCVVLFGMRREEAERQIAVRVRIRGSDAGSPVVTSDEVVIEPDAHPRDILLDDTRNWCALATYWRQPDGADNSEPHQGTASSLLPWDLALGGMGALRLYPFTITIEEDAGEVAETERLLTLEMKGPANGGANPQFFRDRNEARALVPTFGVRARLEGL